METTATTINSLKIEKITFDKEIFWKKKGYY